MRVQTHNERFILCGGIIPVDRVLTGQLWIADNNIVRIIDVEDGFITYESIVNQKTNIKDSFSFQCRYCLILPFNELPAWATED